MVVVVVAVVVVIVIVVVVVVVVVVEVVVGAITVAVAVMIEDIGEQGIILIIIRIIRAGTTLFTNSSNFSWNKICCWIPAKV